MKVIFLDMDGVMNSFALWRRLSEQEANERMNCWEQHVDPEAVSRLNAVIAATGAKVVISSTWRKMFDPPEMQRILEMHGFSGEVIGRTPDLSYERCPDTGLRYWRGDEIRDWLVRNARLSVTSYVVLDDDCDMTSVAHRHIRTDYDVGFTDADAARAIEMLGENDAT